MKSKEEAAKVLLDAGWTLEEVNNVLVSPPKVNSTVTVNGGNEKLFAEIIEKMMQKQILREKSKGGILYEEPRRSNRGGVDNIRVSEL